MANDVILTRGLPSEAFYRRLCEQASPALIATDTDLRVVFWNAAASELLGVTAEQMLGRPLIEAVPAKRRSLLERLLLRTMRRGETSDFEIRMDAPDGKPRHLAAVLSPIRAEADRCEGVAAWVFDETQRRQLAEQLAQAQKMASLGTLAGGVAHHFNNILGGITTFVDFALTSGDLTAMKRALHMTVEAVARAAKITQSLLSFAEAKDRRSDLADLTEIVLTFAHLVERPLGERGIELRLDLHPVPVIAVEANRMHHILGNLLSNSEEAMPTGGTITISLHRQDRQVYLSFRDTGCGIKPEHLPLVFEPFFTTKGLLAGGDRANPGLGLSVVHGIVVDMGARITVESVLGQGAQFTVIFPIPEDSGKS